MSTKITKYLSNFIIILTCIVKLSCSFKYEDKISIKVLNYRNANPELGSKCFRGDLNCPDSSLITPRPEVKLGRNFLQEWSIPAGSSQLTLQCQSRSGQIKWDYFGQGATGNIDIESTRFVSSSHFEDVRNYLHTSTITFGNISDQLTGKYTCRNIDDQNTFDEFQLFAPQKYEKRPEEGSSITIQVPKNSKQITIPCLGQENFKKGQISLYKKINNNSWKKQSNWFWDPFRGFILQIPTNNLEMDPRVFGQYICKLQKNEKKIKFQRKINKGRDKRNIFIGMGNSPESMGFPEKFPFRRRGVNIHIRRPVVKLNNYNFNNLPGPISVNRRNGLFGPQRPVPQTMVNRQGVNYPSFQQNMGPNRQSIKYPFPPRRGIFSGFIPGNFRPNFGQISSSNSEESGEKWPSSIFRQPGPPYFNQVAKIPPRIPLPLPLPSPLTSKLTNSVQCILKKFTTGFGTPCEPEEFFEFHKGFEDKPTVMEINLMPESEYRFLPIENVIYESSRPFKLQWDVKMNGPGSDWSDEGNEVRVLHNLPDGLFEIEKISPGKGSIEIMGLEEGDFGQVSVEYYDQKKLKQSRYTWKYFIINENDYNSAGISIKKISQKSQEISCKSKSSSRPDLTFIALNATTGCPIKQEEIELTECGVGCYKFETLVKFGEIKCSGDGVEQILKFPQDLAICSSKPYFVERGVIKRMTKDLVQNSSNKSSLVIPCPSNNQFPEKLFLYSALRRRFNLMETDDYETIKINFDPKIGFILNGSKEEMNELPDIFKCSSSSDPKDLSDAVIFHFEETVYQNVKIESSTISHISKDVKFIPDTNQVEISKLPLQLSWESKNELELDEDYKQFFDGEFWSGVYSDRDAVYPYVGTFDLTRIKKIKLILNANDESQFEIRVRNKKTRAIVKTWSFVEKQTKISEIFEWFKSSNKGKGNESIFHITDSKETNYNKLTVENTLMLTCTSVDFTKRPKLHPYYCNTPNACEIMKGCFKKQCYPADAFEVNKCPGHCVQLKMSTSPTTFSKYLLMAKCIGDDGLNEITQIVTQNDPLISSAFYKSMDNSLILRIPYELEWQLSDFAEFQCFGKRHVYSYGIKWGVEYSNGSLFYFNGDSENRDYMRNYGDLKSNFGLKIDSLQLKKVWCFAPLINSSSSWGNLSHPIIVHTKGYKDCRLANYDKPQIRVSFIEEFSQTFRHKYESNRVDHLPYIILKKDPKSFSTSKDFEIIANSPDPLEWEFEGSLPASSLIVSSARSSGNFFNPSTICYTSKLSRKGINNLTPNDTGVYKVKVKSQPWKSSSIFIFVPSEFPPYLINNGREMNVKWNSEKMTFPCQVNNPEISVKLFKFDQNEVITDENLTKMEIDNNTLSYDPTTGFEIFRAPPEYRNFSFICSTDGDLINDTVTINIVTDDFKERTEEEEPDSGELFDDPIKIGFWLENKSSLFKCQSKSHIPPKLIAFGCSNPDDCKLRGQILNKENDRVYKSESLCGVGCSELKIPQHESSGVIYCQGKGVQSKLQFFQGKNSKIVTNLEDLEEYQKVKIQVNLHEGGLRDFRVGEKIKLICKGNQYFYSHGFAWAVERTDGTMKFLEDIKTKEEDFYPNEIQSRIKLSLDNTNISKIWCFAPLFDSTEWRNSSTPLLKIIKK